MGQGEAECFGGRRGERDWIGLVELGFFLIMLGAIFLIMPNVLNLVVNFFKNFDFKAEVYPGVFLPAPTGNNEEFYRALMYFCFAFGIFQIVILILRFVLRSSVGKKARSLGGIVFWFGAGVLANMLVAEGNSVWVLFLSGLVILIGASIIVRGLARALSH